MTTIRYLTATQWGMTWTRPPVAEKLLDPECYIHHVGGGAWMDGSAEVVFRNLNTYAQVTKKYSALDYDVMVHFNRHTDVLTIAEGRGKWMSAATADRNEQGEAVCICGNFTLRAPLPIEVEGVALGVVYGIEHGWIRRDAIILGHKDNPAHVGATGCPGDYMYARLPIVRGRVEAILNPNQPPPPNTGDDDMTICVARINAAGTGDDYYTTDWVRRSALVYPGSNLGLLAALWELEDQGVRFDSPKGTPGDPNRKVPVPFRIGSHSAPTFDALPLT